MCDGVPRVGRGPSARETRSLKLATSVLSGAAAQDKTRALAINGGTAVSAKAVPFMSTALTEADIAAVNIVLKSGMLRTATKCGELEERWTKMTDAKYAMTCANGTCALQLAYEPLIKP